MNYQLTEEQRKEKYNKLYKKAEDYRERKLYDKALKEFLECSELWPNEVSFYNLGIVYSDLGNSTKAKEAYKKSLSYDSNYIDSLYNLGCIFIDEKEFDEAIDLFEKILEQNPKDLSDLNVLQATSNMGICYYNKKEYDNAITFLSRALKINNDHLNAIWYLGRAYLGKGLYEKSLDMFLKHLKKAPDNHFTYYFIGLTYFNLKDYNKAIEFLNKYNELVPNDKESYDLLAKIWLDLGNVSNAFENAEKILKIDANDSQGWNLIGCAYFNNKDYDSAILAYKKSISINKNNEILLCNLGFCYMAKHEFEKAYEIANQTLKFNPKYKLPVYILGKYYYKKCEFQKAIVYFKKYLISEDKLNYINALYYLGKCYLKENQVEQAKKYLEEVIDKDLNHKGAWKLYESLSKLNSTDFSVEIGVGGDWKVEAGQSVFYFKVKVFNKSNYLVTNVQIVLTVPDGLQCLEKDALIKYLEPNTYQSPTFKLFAQNDCVGCLLNGIVSYLDVKGTQRMVNLRPFRIEYVCNLLVPKIVSNEEYENKTKIMRNKTMVRDCDKTIDELESMLISILKENNFYLLTQVQEHQDVNKRKLEGFAQGLYDKQDVALSLILEKQEEGTKLIVKGMSDREEKVTDILKDIDSKCEDIKSNTQLIDEYFKVVEQGIDKLYDRLDEIEDYLVKSLGSDFTKIKHLWKKYRAKEISFSNFFKEAFKILGKIAVKKILVGIGKKFIIPV